MKVSECQENEHRVIVECIESGANGESGTNSESGANSESGTNAECGANTVE